MGIKKNDLLSPYQDILENFVELGRKLSVLEQYSTVAGLKKAEKLLDGYIVDLKEYKKDLRKIIIESGN